MGGNIARLIHGGAVVALIACVEQVEFTVRLRVFRVGGGGHERFLLCIFHFAELLAHELAEEEIDHTGHTLPGAEIAPERDAGGVIPVLIGRETIPPV